MTELSKCPRCGSAPVRERKLTRGGTRWCVACPKCGRHTRWHRPNGGELQEWREIAG